MKVFLGSLFFLLVLGLNSPVFALRWVDLWLTKNQQAQNLMNKGLFKEAEKLFQQPDWQGVAAYRAGDYEQALIQYQNLDEELAYYNKGNALAHLGKYEKAIEAYDKALALKPNDQDAIYNRNLVRKLLKKNQQNKNQKGPSQPKKEKKNENQKNKDPESQNQSDKAHEQNKNQQTQEEASQLQKNNEPESQNPKTDDRKNKTQKDKKDHNQDQERRRQQSQIAEKVKNKDRLEKQQAKEQWLRLIPDDPAGLMRQKFLRDHLRREKGGYQ